MIVFTRFATKAGERFPAVQFCGLCAYGTTPAHTQHLLTTALGKLGLISAPRDRLQGLWSCSVTEDGKCIKHEQQALRVCSGESQSCVCTAPWGAQPSSRGLHHSCPDTTQTHRNDGGCRTPMAHREQPPAVRDKHQTKEK